jgi:enterochelin esterase-like enzyme
MNYYPKKPIELIPQSARDTLFKNTTSNFNMNIESINSDSYLRFIVEEVKPYIDKTYPTISDRDNTFIAGSSMGGLISMYAICEYPEIFGGAACLSTHWPGIMPMDNNPIPESFFSYMEQNLPDPQNHKLYFDYGTETLDAYYLPYQSFRKIME